MFKLKETWNRVEEDIVEECVGGNMWNRGGGGIEEEEEDVELRRRNL